MQDQKLSLDCVLLSVPVELLAEAGFTDDTLLQFTAEEGRIVITADPDTDNLVCDGICEDCPFECICEDREVF